MINDIRIAPNDLYTQGLLVQTPKIQEADFNKLMNLNIQNSETEKKQNNFSLLGAPAGFLADISMLNEEDARASGLFQFNS